MITAEFNKNCKNYFIILMCNNMLDQLPIELLCLIAKFIDADKDFINFCLVCKKLLNLSGEKFITKFICRYDKSKIYKRFNFESIKLCTHEYIEIPKYVTEIKFDLDKLLYLRNHLYSKHKLRYVYKELQKYIQRENIKKITIFDKTIESTIMDDIEYFCYTDKFEISYDSDAERFDYYDKLEVLCVDFVHLLRHIVNYEIISCINNEIMIGAPDLQYSEIIKLNNAKYKKCKKEHKKCYDKNFVSPEL